MGRLVASERVVLITGSTAGIGRAAALLIGGHGARVVITGRSEQRARAVVDQLRGMGNSRCVALPADLSTADGVRGLARAVRGRLGRLDVLINNAGAFFEDRGETTDGFERTWAINLLAPYLLTHDLIDLVQASPQGRVVTVASDAHRGSGLAWDDLQRVRWTRGGWAAYRQSKFAAVLFSAELARRLTDTETTSNSLHPGFVASGFGQNNGLAIRAALLLSRPLQISPRRAAKTVAWATLSSDVERLSGEYFKRRRVALPDAGTADAVAARRLWELAAEQVGVDRDWP